MRLPWGDRHFVHPGRVVTREIGMHTIPALHRRNGALPQHVPDEGTEAGRG